jgi:beta-lactamase regulating signal transducer with metallopeptidase domain/protein involved in polysaccharide export with SLBB domain
MNVLHQAIDAFARFTPSERLGWVLLHSLWEVALVAVVLAAALGSVLRRRSAAARYAACCAALIVMAALPAATGAVAFAAMGYGPVSDAQPGMVGGVVDRPIHAMTAALGTPRVDIMPQDNHALHPLLTAVCYAWVLGIVTLAAWHLFGWARVQRLKARSSQAPAPWQERIAELAATIRLRSRVWLRVSDAIGAPALVGWIRPVVLVPLCALTELSPQQIEALLLHELAHIRRHDYLINLLQTAVETLLFYHPAAWWVGQKIRQEREHCCDDLAAAHCGRLIYARALAAMEEMRAVLVPAPALGSDGGNLLRRIERLVAPPMARSWPPRTRPLAVIAIAILASAGVWVTTSGGAAHAEDGAHPAHIAAATQPDSIRAEDLVPDRADYTIHPNDLIAVTISDLNGPNTATISRHRVTESGNISLPYLEDLVKAAGLTEAQLEAAIVKAYSAAHLIQHAQVTAAITEARGRAFNILGHVARPGDYIMPQSDFRLLDAIALAGGTRDTVDRVRILRGDRVTHGDKGKGPKSRVIDIAADRLFGGAAKLDPEFNVVVRPGDTVLVLGPDSPATAPIGPEKFVQLVVGKDGITFEGKPVTWEQLPGVVEKLQDRGDTVLEISAGSEDVTVGRYFDAQGRAGNLVHKYGFKYLSQAASAPGRGPKADAAPAQAAH